MYVTYSTSSALTLLYYYDYIVFSFISCHLISLLVLVYLPPLSSYSLFFPLFFRSFIHFEFSSLCRVKVDDRLNVRPGSKYFEWERKGVPVRLEIGNTRRHYHVDWHDFVKVFCSNYIALSDTAQHDPELPYVPFQVPRTSFSFDTDWLIDWLIVIKSLLFYVCFLRFLWWLILICTHNNCWQLSAKQFKFANELQLSKKCP